MISFPFMGSTVLLWLVRVNKSVFSSPSKLHVLSGSIRLKHAWSFAWVGENDAPPSTWLGEVGRSSKVITVFFVGEISGGDMTEAGPLGVPPLSLGLSGLPLLKLTSEVGHRFELRGLSSLPPNERTAPDRQWGHGESNSESTACRELIL